MWLKRIIGTVFLSLLIYSLYYKLNAGAAHLNDSLLTLFVGGIIVLILFFGIRKILNS